MTVGLIRGETSGEMRTLTAIGANTPITASTAGALAVLAAVLGTGIAYLATTAFFRDQLSQRLANPPVLDLIKFSSLPACHWRQPAPRGSSPAASRRHSPASQASDRATDGATTCHRCPRPTTPANNRQPRIESRAIRRSRAPTRVGPHGRSRERTCTPLRGCGRIAAGWTSSSWPMRPETLSVPGWRWARGGRGSGRPRGRCVAGEALRAVARRRGEHPAADQRPTAGADGRQRVAPLPGGQAELRGLAAGEPGHPGESTAGCLRDPRQQDGGELRAAPGGCQPGQLGELGGRNPEPEGQPQEEPRQRFAGDRDQAPAQRPGRGHRRSARGPAGRGAPVVCFWYRHQQPGGRRLTEREVAGHALGGTKEWTDASKAAFAALLGRPIDKVLDKADHDIRVRGPLWWTVGETAADARRGYPWVGLPSGGIHAMGDVQHNARGVLVIENADTFQQVCMHCPEVTDRWLCVWGKGSATSGVVAFLAVMSDVPIAVWGDLDAYGVQIVTNLASDWSETSPPWP